MSEGNSLEARYPMPLTGRRRPDQLDGVLPHDLQAGDYWRTNGIWTAYIPGGPVGTLPHHHVEEHEDGTITVEPGGGGISNSIPGHSFHGYIRRGVWDNTRGATEMSEQTLEVISSYLRADRALKPKSAEAIESVLRAAYEQLAERESQ